MKTSATLASFVRAICADDLWIPPRRRVRQQYLDADRAFLADVLGFEHVDAGGGWLILALLTDPWVMRRLVGRVGVGSGRLGRGGTGR